MDQLDEIRQKIDIVELISQYVTLKKAGRNFKGLCPFHSEKTPSFMVSPERQIFKCFGCGAGGDVFGFLMQIDGLDFGEALRELARRSGVELKDYRPTKEQEQKQRLYEINHLAAEYYHYILTKHKVGKRALDYLTNRGVGLSSVKEFNLGYAPDSWEDLLNWLVKKKGYTYQELEAAGLAIRRSGLPAGRQGWYVRFRGRVMFPLTDLQGNVVGFSGRILDEEAKETAKYINSPETALYHKSRHLFGLTQTKNFVREKNQIILVEGELDAISSYQTGVKNVAAIKGSALTEDHVQLLKRFCETIILALDADAAGQMAMMRSLDIVESAGLNLKVVELVGGKDPDELAKSDPQAWKQAVRGAVSLHDFVINSTVKRFGVETAEGKRKVTSEVLPWLVRLQNEVVKAHFVKKLAGILEVNEEAVMEELSKQIKKEQLKRTDKKVEKEIVPQSRQETMENYLLALTIQSNSWAEIIQKIKLEWLANFAIRKIFAQLKKTPSALSMVKFASTLPQELQAVFDGAYLRELPHFLPEEWQEEVDKVAKEVEKLYLHARLTQLKRDLPTQDEDGRTRVIKEMSELLKQLQTLNYAQN